MRTDSRLDFKQELDGYLHKPITRMASYQLLLKAALKKTPEDHADHSLLTTAISRINEILAKMNEVSGHAINKIKLAQLSNLIVYDGNVCFLKIIFFPPALII